MARNMSFSMTTDQIKDRSKTVTRRFGWHFLEPGDEICAVEKAMGLRKGEKINRLAMIRIKSTRFEPLNEITQSDVIAEGFPYLSPEEFVQMLADHYKIPPHVTVNRIEFEYLEGSKMLLCRQHREIQVPMLWTFKFDGAEYWCPYCGYNTGAFGPDADEVDTTFDLEMKKADWFHKATPFLSDDTDEWEYEALA